MSVENKISHFGTDGIPYESAVTATGSHSQHTKIAKFLLNIAILSHSQPQCSIANYHHMLFDKDSI